MPYKIYTYSDPYRIADTDFWKNIKMYPHFCAARTLVNGLVSVMRNDIEGLMCPLDDIVNERIFNKWAKDISLRIDESASYFKCNMENTTDKKFNQEEVLVVFVKEDNSELARFKYNIEDIESKTEEKISITTTTSLIDVYDFYIEAENKE